MGTQVTCELCSDHITNCNVCYNKTFCVTCDSGYFIKTTGTGTNICDSCQTPCLQCFGTATNCTNCASGRQLNYSTRSCDCLTGYYSTGPTTCASCSPTLGSCLQCTNSSVCLQCWQNNYFVMVNGAKKCDLCQVTCLTCATWTTVCATCDSLAHRTLNPSTKQCDCITGYT
jgi:proprotein convertase subtilisin/kexin type 5